jgi:predicted secreted Zn-dependent protease
VAAAEVAMPKKNKREIAKVIDQFLQQYRRRAPRHGEPNDRGYDRKIERYLKRMKPEDLDGVLNGEDGERFDSEKE